MTKDTKIKKRIVISYHNLPVELQEEFKRVYPLGYTDSMIRIEKGLGDFFYAVMLETEEISYLVKVDVKIDGKIEEEDEDKDYYDDDIKGADEIVDNEEEEED